MHRSLRAWAAWLLLSPICLPADLRVEIAGVESEAGGSRILVSASWKGAWSDDVNHDAAWVVIRHQGEPVPLSRLDWDIANGPVSARVEVSEDRVGAFVFAAEPWSGDVQWTVSFRADEPVALDPSALSVSALEMVYVPEGPFELGDDHPRAREQGAIYAADGEGGAAGPYRVRDRGEIAVGRAQGDLYYDVGEVPQYRGDRSGPIPADYPKGFASFYVMKYEVRQGQYAAFLNALPADLARRRAFETRDGEEEEHTGTIALRDGEYVATAPDRPCNFLSWDDSCAFADWMGLRPLSELEFEKASRGPDRPVALDYPWGDAEVTELERRVTEARDLSRSTAEDERSLSRDTRATYGASYYRVFDLAGSLWERVVSIGHPIGRAYRGSHGDGWLDPATGDATNDDWPGSSEDGRTADGIGYRGGAEYFKEPSITNPYSPVGLRTYGAWNGAYRYKTYSARACRSAPRPYDARTLEITLLANAGVELRVGEKRVLYDSFLRESYAGCGAIDEPSWERLLRRPADVALATHVHGDHLQVQPALEYLARNEQTLFVSSEQSVAALRDEAPESMAIDSRTHALNPQGTEHVRVSHRGVEVTAFRLVHGGGARAVEIQNLGLVVTVGGFRVLHVGDADGLAPNFDPHDLGDLDLHVALVPYWYFGSTTGREVASRIGARALIAVHIPPGEEDAVARQVQLVPGAAVLRPGESWYSGP